MKYPSICFLVLLTFIHTESGRVSSIRACGSRLTDILNLVCDKKFNGPDNVTQQSDARSLIRSLFRRSYDNARRGVADECCRNPCDIDVLKSYCADPNGEVSDLLDLLPNVINTEVTEKTTDMAEANLTQEPYPVSTTTHRPNLGLFSRNRPFFIVMSTPLMRTGKPFINSSRIFRNIKQNNKNHKDF